MVLTQAARVDHGEESMDSIWIEQPKPLESYWHRTSGTQTHSQHLCYTAGTLEVGLRSYNLVQLDGGLVQVIRIRNMIAVVEIPA